MGALQPATVLRRAAELEVRITAAGDVIVVTDRGFVSGGPHCLAILDLFSEPTTLADALETLGARAGGGQDWIDLSAAIMRLAGAGVLVIVATLQADPSKATGFDAAVKTLGHAPFGRVLLVVAALGIAAFGAYSFVRSRHGRM